MAIYVQQCLRLLLFAGTNICCSACCEYVLVALFHGLVTTSLKVHSTILCRPMRVRYSDFSRWNSTFLFSLSSRAFCLILERSSWCSWDGPAYSTIENIGIQWIKQPQLKMQIFVANIPKAGVESWTGIGPKLSPKGQEGPAKPNRGVPVYFTLLITRTVWSTEFAKMNTILAVSVKICFIVMNVDGFISQPWLTALISTM